MGPPSLGSEDFAQYLRHVPGAYLRLGARQAAREPVPLHSPRYTVDEAVLAFGAFYFDQLARRAIDTYGRR